MWITLEDGAETLFAWMDAVTISKRSGRVKIRISNTLKPYLLQLKTHFTQYELIYTLAMKSRYSLRLYELLKSYEYQQEAIFSTEELKVRLSAENYKLFGDFKRKVLDISMREINNLSDLNVTYEIIKEKQRFAKLAFSIKRKQEIDENIKTWRNIYKIIENSSNNIERG
jgi:plasmid replication initiation protein